MSHQWIRCNLAAQLFPLVTDIWGRSIIVPQYDENYERVTVSPADLGKDKGVPQVYYLHNCMPTSTGFQAIGYDLRISGIPGNTDFDQIFPLQDVNDNRALFVPSQGKNYIVEAPGAGWSSIDPIDPSTLPTDALVTTAFVQGQTYIYYEATGCFKYTLSTNTLDPVTLTGLDPAAILGICAANGYMIAFTATDVAWSSETDPTDFTASLVSGAGGGTVNDAKGNIICCLPIANGFIVYCEKNAVGAKYTGNANFPYNIIEIPASGGISGPSQVSWQGNMDPHYCWTNQGLQSMSLTTGANNIFPEVTEFLSGRVYEDFNETTLEFDLQYLIASLNIKVSIISNQYLVISYGLPQTNILSFALIYDLNRARWGKVKIDHVAAFQWNGPGNNLDLTYAQASPNAYNYSGYSNYSYQDMNQIPQGPADVVNKNLAFLGIDGTVNTVNFDLGEENASGVLLLGKYQMQRNKGIVHQRTDTETVLNSSDFDMYIIPTLDGKTFLPAVQSVLLQEGPLSRRYGKRVAGMNYSLLFMGAFNMTSVLTDFTIGGER